MRFSEVLEGLNLFSRPARSAAPSPLQTDLLSSYDDHARSTPEHTGLFKRLRDRAVYGVPVGLVNTHSRFFENLEHVGISA